MKYLAAPVSSAPVERIFSVGGKIFPPDRCCLSDTTFQQLMFIKLNKHFCHLMFNIEQNMFRVSKGIQLTLFANHESIIEYIYYCYNCYYLPHRRRPGTGDIATPPRLSVRPSVHPSVTSSFRTVTQKCIDVFSRNFTGTCTMSWGCAV